MNDKILFSETEYEAFRTQIDNVKSNINNIIKEAQAIDVTPAWSGPAATSFTELFRKTLNELDTDVTTNYESLLRNLESTLNSWETFEQSMANAMK